MSENFKPGDLVELKSGGVTMVLHAKYEIIGEPECWECVWHDKKKPYREVYKTEVLKKHEPTFKRGSSSGARNL